MIVGNHNDVTIYLQDTYLSFGAKYSAGIDRDRQQCLELNRSFLVIIDGKEFLKLNISYDSHIQDTGGSLAV